MTRNVLAAIWRASLGLSLLAALSIGGAFAALDAPIFNVRGATIDATEGVTFTGTVASFTDGDPRSTATEYEATIAWGDGSSSPGTITGTGGSFTVSGAHMYAEQGTYVGTVTITDVDNTTSNTTNTTVTLQATVGDGALASSCATLPLSTQTYTGPTVVFADSSATGTLSDFTATIDWGDGTTSAGTITGVGGNAPYTVSGTHTYTSTGTFLIATTINDVGGRRTSSTCSVSTPRPPCREDDGEGDVPGKRGSTAHFSIHQSQCKSGETDSEDFSDPSSGIDFHSTRVNSVSHDDVAHSVTIAGLGTDNGFPVTFTIIAVDSTAVPPGMFSIILSDGYSNSANLLDGSITLH